MNMEFRKEVLKMIERMKPNRPYMFDTRDVEIVSKLKSGDTNWNSDPVADQFHAVLFGALKDVISAVGKYHMPDGIGLGTAMNRVIAATDNPKFNAAWLYEKATQVIPKNTDPASAEDVLIVAAELVTGNRRESHGEMYESFSQVAAMWTSFLNGRDLTAKPLKPHEVCDMMELLKMSRSTKGDFNHDDYIDRAGYAACAFEVRKRDDETAKGGQ